MTRYTGMPQLKSGEYVLIDAARMEPHDRDIGKDAVIAVLKRDGNRCQKCGWHPKDRIPGDPRQYIELHHVNWHAEGGSNEPDNLATLCNVHHKTVHTLKLNPEDFKRWLSEAAG
jgi:predicted HNH restriction endonuclease